MDASLSLATATALVNISLAGMVGVLASRFWLMKATAQSGEQVIKRLSLAMTVGLFACVIATALSLWSEAAVMGDSPWLDAGTAFFKMLAGTHYGHAGLAALSILLLALVAHWRLDRRRADMGTIGIMAALVLLLAAARVSSGHAYENGPLSVAVCVEFLHLLLMSLWAGSVFVAGWVVLPCVAANKSNPDEGRTAYLTTLSDWSTAALVGIIATGAYNTYRVLGGPRDLIAGDYGHILLFKLFFVLVAIALGGFNRFHGLPVALSPKGTPTEKQRGLGAVIAILRIESIVLLLVLMAAAILTTSAPPR
jgi:putative copper resistance protein D